MLSSQTKDEVTDVAVDKLRAAFGGTLSLDALLAAEEHVIADAISKVGFWRRKTQSVFLPCLFLLTGANGTFWKKKIHQVRKAGCAAPAGRL
jgi:endonuclease III